MSAPLPVSAVLIDLDGTLLDTIHDLAAAANAMLTELSRSPLPVTTVRGFVGKGIPNLVMRCLSGSSAASEADVSAALPIFWRHYAVVNGLSTRIYPGAITGLEAMRQAGFRLACITNKAAAFTGPLLHKMSLAPYFEMVVSGDSLPEKKPHPLPFLHVCEQFGIAPRHALVIGDSRNDVAGARAAGCPVFCVPYGYSEGEDMHDLGADAIVATLAEAAQRIVRLTTNPSS